MSSHTFLFYNIEQSLLYFLYKAASFSFVTYFLHRELCILCYLTALFYIKDDVSFTCLLKVRGSERVGVTDVVYYYKFYELSHKKVILKIGQNLVELVKNI